MAGRPAGLRWAEAVAATDAVAGAVLLIAGLYLIEPEMVDLGLYLEADRYLLAGFVLAYAGLVFTYAGLLGLAPPSSGFVGRLAGGLFGTAGRLCVGALMLTFAARAWAGGLSPLWAVVPALFGVLALASVPLAAVARARAAGPPADPTITPQSGKRAPFRPVVFLRDAASFVVSASASVFVLGVALVAYILLDRAFIEGRPISLGVAVQVVRESLVPIVVLVGQLMIALFAIVGLAAWVGERHRRHEAGGRERDLSPEEVSFAAACVAQIRAYAAARGLTRRSAGPFLATVGLGIVIALLLVSWDDDRLIAGLYAPQTEAWQLYVVEGPGAKVAGLLLLVSLAFVPNAILKLVSPRAAEASGANMLKVSRPAGELESEIVKRVRDRSLGPGMAFDAGELMRTWGVTTGVMALVWNLLLLGGIALWWPHDRARDTLFTEHTIETGDFWTLDRTIYRYSDVQAVNVMCDDDAGVDYELVLPGDIRRDLLAALSLRRRLDDVTKVDAKLRAAGVAFQFALPDEALASELPVVDRMCVLDFAEGLDETAQAKVEQVFHLDEWYERRWRMRTGQRPRVAGQ